MDNKTNAYECIAKVESLIDQAETSHTEEARATALASAVALADQCLKASPKEADCWFIKGLAMYHSLTAENDLGNQVEQCLNQALHLDENHQFARLYLGHYYYDTERFDQALSEFKKVDESYFSSINQIWRVPKLRELILCCKLNLNSSDIDIHMLISLIEEYDHTPSEDAPIPLEIAITLMRTRNNPIWQRINRDDIVRLFVRMLERKGYRQVLQKYIECF
jgi:tetratricopeptide (TPR) repeat protein